MWESSVLLCALVDWAMARTVRGRVVCPSCCRLSSFCSWVVVPFVPLLFLFFSLFLSFPFLPPSLSSLFLTHTQSFALCLSCSLSLSLTSAVVSPFVSSFLHLLFHLFHLFHPFILFFSLHLLPSFLPFGLPTLTRSFTHAHPT